MKPTINLKPGESPSAAMLRLYKCIRRIDRSYQPGSLCIVKANVRRAKLRVVR